MTFVAEWGDNNSLYLTRSAYKYLNSFRLLLLFLVVLKTFLGLCWVPFRATLSAQVLPFTEGECYLRRFRNDKFYLLVVSFSSDSHFTEFSAGTSYGSLD